MVNQAAGDPVLFREIRQPQLPYERCRLPEVPSPSSRRLAMRNPVLLKAAEEACAGKTDYALCVDDVMVVGSIDIAEDF